MEIVELKEVAGYMYVNAEHSIVARFGYCPKLTPICGHSHPKLKPSLSRRSGEQREVNSRQRVTNNGGGV